MPASAWVFCFASLFPTDGVLEKLMTWKCQWVQTKKTPRPQNKQTNKSPFSVAQERGS